MFQGFEDVSDPASGKERVQSLRKKLVKLKLTAFLIPRSDEFQNEYVHEGAERLRWLTGFGGSAGFAVVTLDKAAIFVDGRYTLQVRDQVDTKLFDVYQVPEYGIKEWINAHLQAGDRLGYDSSLHTMAVIGQLKKQVKKAGASLIAVRQNPVDQLWKDQPDFPKGEIQLHDTEFAGETHELKIKNLQDTLKKDKIFATVITSPPSLAWLFNIRGEDVACTPLALGYAIVPASGKAQLYFYREKVPPHIRKFLKSTVVFKDFSEFSEGLRKLGNKKKLVSLDPAQVSARIGNSLRTAGAQIIHQQDPCILPKAIKNETEQEGARDAHLRDGVAVVQFLSWLDAQKPGGVNEIIAVEKLEEYRRATGALKNISFETISGAGPNGAIVHYRVSKKTNRKLNKNSLYLVDSGGQYLDGTTDITRTVIIGKPTKGMIRHFTLVLKGHILLAMARFPKGTRGCDLDVLARNALWQAGLDYAHGTGHGVGSYLSVHEGPQGISRLSTVTLKAGMIISNEPGYYKEGAYGIRIENLVLVKKAEDVRGGDKPMMQFETLTKVPIDRRLIDSKLLGTECVEWLNDYHQSVYKQISMRLKKQKDVDNWLKKATQPL